MTTNKQALSVEEMPQYMGYRCSVQLHHVCRDKECKCSCHCAAPEPSDAEIREHMEQIVLHVQSSTPAYLREVGYSRIEKLLRTEAAYKRGKGQP